MASVSVIVPIYNVEDYLLECLDSLAEQTLNDLEVIMVDDGSTDSSGEIAKQYAAKDLRFKYFYKENGGLGHARNFGVKYATGKYIAFLDSDDIIPFDAYKQMFDIAQNNDCEIVTGGVVRFNEKKESASGLHRKAFDGIKPITSILETPNLVFDTTSTNKIYSKEFFKDNCLKFPEGVAYEDIPLTMRAFCRAKRVGCTLRTVYKWRIREGSISQRRTEINNFLDRLDVLRMMKQVFLEEGMPDSLFRAMYKKWLDLDFKLFINQMLDADDEYRRVAIEKISQLMKEIDEDVYSEIDAIDRIKYFYISNSDLKSLLGVLCYQKKGYKTLKVKQVGNKFYGKFPFKGLDDSVMEMTNEITRKLYTRVDEVNFSQNLVISGEISSSYLNCEKKRDIAARWFLVDKHGNRVARFDASLEAYKPYRKIKVSKIYRTFLIRSLKYRHFVISIPASKLKDLPRGEYWVEVDYSYKGIQFCTQKLKRAAKRIEAKPYAFKLSDSKYIAAEYDFLSSLCIKTEDIAAEAVEVELSQSGELTAKCSDGSKYSLTAIIEGGHPDDVPCNFNLVPRFVLYNNLVAIVKSEKDGKIDACKLPLGVRVIKVKEIGSKLILSIDSLGLLSNNFDLYLFGVEFRTEVLIASYKEIDFENNIFNLTIDLSDKKITHLLRTDTYELIIKEGTSNVFAVYSGIDRSEKSKSLVSDGYEYTFKTSMDICCLSVGQIRPWSESTKLKRKIIEYYIYPILRLLPIKKNTVVFESSWGAKTDCNPGAIYLYFQKNHPEYECIWLLNDVRIPFQGNGKAVRRGTFGYFNAISRAHYFVNNVNFANDYKKRSGQIEIQTMHGTPLKTLGLDVPGELDDPDVRAAFIRRCSRWDYLVVQSDTAKEITKSCYAYKKAYLTTGYPRNDVLFEKNNSYDISLLKQKYGIDATKKLVLYAPTWRTRNRFDLMLDLQLMHERLGNKYEIAIRVHQFAVNDKIAFPSFVHDFTHAQSMEELFLISDIVITDYSSLMFDYAILKRPLLFYVYDLEEYRDNLRGFNLDFESEAPGPLLFTSEQVIESIENIEDTKKKYANKFNEFRQKYCMYEVGTASEQIFNQVFK